MCDVVCDVVCDTNSAEFNCHTDNHLKRRLLENSLGLRAWRMEIVKLKDQQIAARQLER